MQWCWWIWIHLHNKRHVPQAMFALVAALLALGSAHAGRALKAPMLPPLPIDPRAEAMAATITTADSLAAAVPLFSPTNTIMVPA